MSTLPPDIELGNRPVQEFVIQRGLAHYLVAAGGAALIAVAMGSFIIALFTHTSQLHLQLSTTLPLLMGIGMVLGAFAGRRAPDRIIVDADGLLLSERNGPHRINWKQITWASRDTAALSKKPRLVLFGDGGTVIRKIPSVYDGFDALTQTVLEVVKQQAHPLQLMTRLRKARREGWLCLIIGIAFLALSISIVVMSWQDRRDALDLSERGQQGMATIEEKVVAPNGVTKRIYYRVDAKRPDGNRPQQMNVEFDPNLWQLLVAGQKIPVIYVPDRPDVSKPSMGEIADDGRGSPGAMMVLGFGFGTFCLLLIGWGIVSLKGVVLEKDETIGRFRIRNLKKTSDIQPT